MPRPVVEAALLIDVATLEAHVVTQELHIATADDVLSTVRIEVVLLVARANLANIIICMGDTEANLLAN